MSQQPNEGITLQVEDDDEIKQIRAAIKSQKETRKIHEQAINKNSIDYRNCGNRIRQLEKLIQQRKRWLEDEEAKRVEAGSLDTIIQKSSSRVHELRAQLRAEELRVEEAKEMKRRRTGYYKGKCTTCGIPMAEPINVSRWDCTVGRDVGTTAWRCRDCDQQTMSAYEM